MQDHEAEPFVQLPQNQNFKRVRKYEQTSSKYHRTRKRDVAKGGGDLMEGKGRLSKKFRLSLNKDSNFKL